ncbi:MATE family efflux transporter [Mucilaginibacter auburnensis]|uniref:Multidrug-efflux transporter n=1 Tax=Mucilaginibacter auburnensis TaxID=1457233 RepID=A0A2H9VL35_9SPHI|nr:MATE family efflux transporter [Mucilaginibacter auburnensis]PJJ79050.1 MATE family multidrug resistance protein [Mucilaginibacter auburnensis]
MKTTYKKYKNHYRDNLKLAIPVVISQMGHTLVHASDSIIVGHFAGTVSLAAVSLASSIFVVPMVIGIGISYGSTPLIAQHNSREEFSACGRLLSNSLFINLLSGILLFSFIAVGSAYALEHLKQDQKVIVQAKPFLILLGTSIIPMLVFNTFKQFAEGLGFTKQAMLISIWGNILNICLGIIFVKGLFGIKPMGIMGVGYSTLIDRCTMALVMAVYIFRSKHFKKYLTDFSLTKIDAKRCLQILGIGGPVALQYGFEVSAFSGAAVIIGSIGLVQLAAHQIAINLASITYMMSSGLSAAAAIKSGNYFGVRDHSSLRKSANASYHVVIAFMAITAIIFTIGNNFLPWIYTEDKAVIAVASQLLIIAAMFQLFDGTQVIGLGILRGMSDVNIPTLITFFAYWVLGLPLGWLLGIYLDWGVSGVWYGLTAGLLASAILLYTRFKVISHKHRLADRNALIIARD